MHSKTHIEHVGIGSVLEAKNLCVPSNQRSYSWREEQIDDLLVDLGTALENKEKEYFMGSIVLTKPENGRPCVVDGQQRLASATMIYAAIRDYLLEISENEIANRLANQYLCSTDKWKGTEEPKLTLSSQDSHFFELHVLAKPESTQRKASKTTRLSPDSHKRISAAFTRIRKHFYDITSKTHDPIALLKKWDEFLYNSARVLVLTVEDESNAFQIFETLNDRGLDLATADLLKNYLFGKAGKDKLESVKHAWSTAVSRVGDGEETAFKKFIHHFWASKNGLTREKLLYNDIKAKVKSPHSAIQFVTELSESASNYAAILNSDHDIWNPTGTTGREAVSTLKMLKLEQYKPLLLACMDTIGFSKPAELKKLLRALVSWSVRFRVTQQFGSSRLESFYQNGGKIVRTKSLATSKSVIDELCSTVPSDLEFKKAFENFSEESGKIARYYLRELEKVVRTQNKITEQISHDEEEVNLEHILPKEPDFSIWTDFTPDTINLYKYRLGNQTLLNKKENKEIGNDAFSTKKSFYGKSDIILTKEVSKSNTWKESDIESHQKWLSSLAVKAWRIEG